ncbi:MAG TPA: hypothetical protein VE955_00750 [Candidatus Dormibacteraeota bacterium]|nr:hypothetical protein [Candidatus Dormibacteraeota bacterium]
MKLRSAFVMVVALILLAPTSFSPLLAHGDGSSCDGSTLVLLIQDVTPWPGSTSHDPSGADFNELMAQNIPFCMISSSQLSTINLNQFREIIIPSAQNQPFYDNLFPNGSFSSEISSWVAHGGVLSANLADCASAPDAGGGWSFSACSTAASSYTFVGGVGHVGDFSDDNNIVTSSSPVVTGQYGGNDAGQIVDNGCLQDLDCWASSSHAYFTDLPDGTTVILSEQNGPVFIEYGYGDGLVIATTTSIEWRYDYFQQNFQNPKLLANEIGYQNFKAMCQEKDGDGHFNGNHGKGHFHFSGDKCENGDPDIVWSSDIGDGRSFNSTQFLEVQFDLMSLPRTITITGLGTLNGLPVSFTFSAVETDPTTPGFASFVFSDGTANAGPLVDGSVTLHGWQDGVSQTPQTQSGSGQGISGGLGGLNPTLP